MESEYNFLFLIWYAQRYTQNVTKKSLQVLHFSWTKLSSKSRKINTI